LGLGACSLVHRIPSNFTDAKITSLIVAANIIRRHLTAEQKRDLVAKLVESTPQKSDRAIAADLKVDKNVVSRARKKVEANGATAPVEKRMGKDGKSRRLPKKKSKLNGAADPVTAEPEAEQAKPHAAMAAQVKADAAAFQERREATDLTVMRDEEKANPPAAEPTNPPTVTAEPIPLQAAIDAMIWWANRTARFMNSLPQDAEYSNADLEKILFSIRMLNKDMIPRRKASAAEQRKAKAEAKAAAKGAMRT
jgi:hypothetical protein